MSLDCHNPGILSEYREFPAPAPLATRFRCFWTQTIIGSQGTYEHRGAARRVHRHRIHQR
jgi:hypothetical protein